MNKFMEEADRLARENLVTNNGGPFGAVVVRDGVIVGRGNNHVLKDNDPTAHGEIVAIRDACKNLNTYDLTGCIIYTSSYPCPMCISAIIWSNIKLVYYGNTKEDAENIGFRDDKIYNFIDDMETEGSKETLLLKELNHDQTIKAFNEFKSKKDKTIY